MVDPHRKINILTEDQQNFIEDCEEEFRGRFTEDDEEFMAYCQKPRPPPPILDPWLVRPKFNDNRSGNNEGYNRGRNFNYHNRGRNDYRHHHRGGGRERDGNSGYNRPQGHDNKRKYSDRY